MARPYSTSHALAQVIDPEDTNDLARAVNATAVNASEYQTGGASDETTLLAAADYACDNGLALYIPKRTTEWVTSVPIPILAGIKVFSDGAVIRQSTWNKPVFDLEVTDDVTIEGFHLRSTATKVNSGSSFRGDDENNYSAGVWGAGDRLAIQNIRCEGFFIGVHVTNWTTGSTHAGRRESNTIQNIRVSGVDYGILAVDQDGLHLENIRGTYIRTVSSGDPAHLVYITGNHSAGGTNTRGLTGGNWHAWDSGTVDGDPPYQLRKVEGAGLGALTARNCYGLLNYETITDTTFDKLVAMDCQRNDENGTIMAIDATSFRVRMHQVIIDKAVSGRSIKIDGEDVVVENAVVYTNRAVQNFNSDVRVAGTRSGISNLILRNSATTSTGAVAVVVADGTNNFVRDIDALGCVYGMGVESGCTNTRLIYDSDLIQNESGFPKTYDNGTGTRHFFLERRGLKTPVRVAAPVNVTISAPGATIDGVTMAAKDRVLLANQTTGSANGIYRWNGAAVAMTRDIDSDTADKITDSLLVTVDEGTVNKDSIFTLAVNKPITMGSTALRFTRVHPSYEQSSHPISSAFQPTNSKLENLPRDTIDLSNQAALTTQIVRVFPLGVLRAGDTLSNINFVVATTASATITNSWAGIARLSDRVVLAVSATSTATTAANTKKTFAFGTPYTADKDETLIGFVMYQATTVPSLFGINHGNAVILSEPPIINGTSNTGATTPVSVAATLTAFTADTEMIYAWCE